MSENIEMDHTGEPNCTSSTGLVYQVKHNIIKEVSLSSKKYDEPINGVENIQINDQASEPRNKCLLRPLRSSSGQVVQVSVAHSVSQGTKPKFTNKKVIFSTYNAMKNV